MLRKTPLYDIHVGAGAKMGSFAGYDMPLQYEGALAEHKWTRNNASLFDISHMGQIRIEGTESMALLHTLTPSSFMNLLPHRSKYTVITNDQGGIIDDMIVTRVHQGEFFLVVNGARKQEDIAHIMSFMPKTVGLTHFENRGLLALQGPEAERVMTETLGLDLMKLPYMGMIVIDDIYIFRMGYTGEDGFEISIPNEHLEAAWERFTEHLSVRPAGLVARDVLRLEMGYCLYGQDIDETTSPIEATLDWVVAKDADEFIGSSRILHEMEHGPSRRRVGFMLEGKGMARQGYKILNKDGEKIGEVTSGTHSPSLGRSVGMAYVISEYSQEGTPIDVIIRDKAYPATIAHLPFLEPKTMKGSKI